MSAKFTESGFSNRHSITILMIFNVNFFIWISGVLISVGLKAQNTELPDRQFENNVPFHINISYNFSDLDKLKEESEFIPGKISYYLPDSVFIQKSIKIGVRGKSRREQCLHPPLRIDFSDTLFGVSLFENAGRLKLVSECQSAGKYENYINREYLIYKIYEKFTDICFRTWLVSITFIDGGNNKRYYNSPGFFIEDIDDLAKRLNAVEVKMMGLKPENLDTLNFDRMALFQYMIGNTDWHVQNLHNIRLIKLNDFNKQLAIPIPYDFDYAGLVNASYAVPGLNLPITNVRDRYYLGLCRRNEQNTAQLKIFYEKKDEIYNVISGFGSLNNFDRNDITKFIDGFYKIIENEKSAGRNIFSNCR
jgi:hypothetical protein